MPDETYQGWFKKGSAYLRLKLPGICENCATPVAWNNLHEIIGQYPTDDADLDDSLASFEKVGSTVERIDLPGMRDTITKGINDAGDIVGTYIDPDFNRHAFILHPDGSYATLTPPSGLSIISLSPEDVNNLGHIVGTIWDDSGSYHGFILVNGAYTVFQVPGGKDTLAYGMNDHGHVVGAFLDGDHMRGFLLKGGRFTTINVTADAQSEPRGVNNHGHIAGTFTRPYDGGLAHGFLAVPKATKVSQR
jgi:probable HAF family extracellular repeat protein